MKHRNCTDARREKWDNRYMELALRIALWSKDPSTKVGAVLVRANNSIASAGFNGFAPGADDSPELYADREYKKQRIIHAERNVFNFLSDERDAEGGTLYVTFPVCPSCMNTARTYQIARVVTPPLPTAGRTPDWLEEWENNIDWAARIARQSNIQWDFFA